MILRILITATVAVIGAVIIKNARKSKMYNCQKDISDYHSEHVTLLQGERTKMKERRDSNRKRIQKNLLDDDPVPIGFQTQGSYAMHTMVKAHDNDYDIDDGVYFDEVDLVGSRGAELTPRSVKEIVCAAAQNSSFNKEPDIRTNCVRVYYNDGSHVDIPVYRRVVEETFWDDEKISYQLAGADWKSSDPKAVTDWFNSENKSQSPDNDNGRQLRRIVRLIKKFSNSRDSWKKRSASGFIISKLVSECYSADDGRDDRSLYNTMKAIRNRLDVSLEVSHPILDEYLTSGENDSKTNFLKQKIDWALEGLEDLFEGDCDDATALETWGRTFNSTFFYDRAEEARTLAEESLLESIAVLSVSEHTEREDSAIQRVKHNDSGYQPWSILTET